MNKLTQDIMDRIEDAIRGGIDDGYFDDFIVNDASVVSMEDPEIDNDDVSATAMNINGKKYRITLTEF